MKNNKKTVHLIACLTTIMSSNLAISASARNYSDDNQGIVQFDVSMPIDASGYTLKGHHLTGGNIHFSDRGRYVNRYLAHEVGSLEPPQVTSTDNKPLITTHVKYNVIKFIDPLGVNNFFIKIGIATRRQEVSGLDPSVLKDGVYRWPVPLFSAGRESNSVNQKSHNIQFMQIGSSGGPASSNVMYTQDFYVYSQGKGSMPIPAHPIKTARSNETLTKEHDEAFSCRAQGLWGAGGADPFRTVKGHCKGSDTVFPAAPNLDYEYGSFILPSVHTPWNATASDHCVIKGKRHAHCVNATLNIHIHYMAQKIRVPINKTVSIFAEFGTAYRGITPTNLRYNCKNNVYLKHILPRSECSKSNYLPGGSSHPYFAVGYQFTAQNGKLYSARYINIPGQENGNRLTWIDASDTQIYAISTSGNTKTTNEFPAKVRQEFTMALNKIRAIPSVYNVLAKHFFIDVLKRNQLYTPPHAKTTH